VDGLIQGTKNYQNHVNHKTKLVTDNKDCGQTAGMKAENEQVNYHSQATGLFRHRTEVSDKSALSVNGQDKDTVEIKNNNSAATDRSDYQVTLINEKRKSSVMTVPEKYEKDVLREKSQITDEATRYGGSCGHSLVGDHSVKEHSKQVNVVVQGLISAERKSSTTTAFDSKEDRPLQGSNFYLDRPASTGQVETNKQLLNTEECNRLNTPDKLWDPQYISLPEGSMNDKSIGKFWTEQTCCLPKEFLSHRSPGKLPSEESYGKQIESSQHNGHIPYQSSSGIEENKTTVLRSSSTCDSQASLNAQKVDTSHTKGKLTYSFSFEDKKEDEACDAFAQSNKVDRVNLKCENFKITIDKNDYAKQRRSSNKDHYNVDTKFCFDYSDTNSSSIARLASDENLLKIDLSKEGQETMIKRKISFATRNDSSSDSPNSGGSNGNTLQKEAPEEVSFEFSDSHSSTDTSTKVSFKHYSIVKGIESNENQAPDPESVNASDHLINSNSYLNSECDHDDNESSFCSDDSE